VRTIPLPARILIPVANPATAEELIHLGADLLDQRSGELTALCIVEVAEGVPLSEGATRARRVDDERIALPMPGGIAHPRRLRIRLQRAAVGEDLPPEGERLVEDDDGIRRLDQLPRIRDEIDLRHTLRQTVRVGIFAGVRTVLTLVEQTAGPGLIRHVVVADVERQIANVAVVVGHPNALQIDAAVRVSRRRRFEIDFTVR
jgi:hypothetical protein